MIKGGYKIIDFKGTALSGTAVEISGIYDRIVDEYDKAILVSGVVLNGKLQDDAFASVSDTEDTMILTVYGGIITVTEDDEVSFTLVKSNTELASDIGDLNNLETTEKSSAVNSINEVNGKLYLNINTFTELESIPIEDGQALTAFFTDTFMNVNFDDSTFAGGFVFKISGRLVIFVVSMARNTIYKGNFDFVNHVWTSKAKVSMDAI